MFPAQRFCSGFFKEVVHFTRHVHFFIDIVFLNKKKKNKKKPIKYLLNSQLLFTFTKQKSEKSRFALINVNLDSPTSVMHIPIDSLFFRWKF